MEKQKMAVVFETQENNQIQEWMILNIVEDTFIETRCLKGPLEGYIRLFLIESFREEDMNLIKQNLNM